MKANMRIAILADSFLQDKSASITGTHVQLYNLARAFWERNQSVHYLCLTRKWKRSFDIINGLKIHWIPKGWDPLCWVAEIRSYNKILDEIQPDALYQRGRSHLTYVAALWAKKNRKIFVWASNGDDSCDFWKNIKFVHKSNRFICKKWLLYPIAYIQDLLIHKGVASATHVVNQIEYQRSQLWKNFRKKGMILPSYFPLPKFDSSRLKKEKLVLWLAHLRPLKHPEIFLQLAAYCADCLGWKFILVGGTDKKRYAEQVSKSASALKNVEVKGSIPFADTADYFARAALFVDTSAHEGVANTLIHSMLHHTPVLSLTQDPNEWISTYQLGVTARGDIEEFLRQGKELIKNYEKREILGENCFNFAAKTFSAKSTIDTYLRLFASR